MPTQVQAGTTTFSYVSAGYDFACGVASNGVGYCWGNNYAGQLGNGTTNPSSNPVQVSGGLTWKVIRAGRTASVCGITTTDVLYCWGSNFMGQLGNGTFNDVPVPTRVLAAGAFQWAQPADTHACGISAGPAVYCWGEDVRGQLGKGWETNAQRTPVPVLIGPASAPVPVTELSGSPRSVDSGSPRPEATGAGPLRKGNRPRRR
jgi:alpha-tubulin suppressor-like RCC1 family protein